MRRSELPRSSHTCFGLSRMLGSDFPLSTLQCPTADLRWGSLCEGDEAENEPTATVHAGYMLCASTIDGHQADS